MSKRRSSRPWPMLRPGMMLRPSILMRRKALTAGVFGSSRFWKVMAVVLFGSSTLRRMFGKRPEIIETTVFKGAGHVMQITTLPASTRRQRRRAS